MRYQEVRLEPAEIEVARLVAKMRNDSASSYTPAYGFKGDCLDVHVLGACGECAFAKAMGWYWDFSVNTFARPDVGNVQVRTRSSHEYDLLVRPKDTGVFVCVTGELPTFRVWGWIDAEEAKVQKYLKSYADRPPAYFVPKDALTDLIFLPAGAA